MATSMEVGTCRMYEQEFPEKDELVMVTVTRVTEMGAYVKLREYNDIEGMILLTELSRKRIRSIPKLIRVGRDEVVVVVRVDADKGYIDLSKRRVSPEEVTKCEEKYVKSKTVHSIMNHVAETCGINLEQFYKDLGWPLYKKHGHAYDAFKKCITDADAILGDANISEEVKAELLKNIRRRLTPQPLKIRSDVEVTCYHYEGVDSIKKALTAGKAASTEECPVKIKLVAPPVYVITTTALDKAEGIAVVEKAVQLITEEITKLKGDINVKMAPKAVTETDERALTTLMEELEKANTEVGGDDSNSESD